MELVLGGRYRNRLNQLVEIVKEDNGNYPFVGDSGRRYMRDGSYVDSKCGAAVFNLVTQAA